MRTVADRIAHLRPCADALEWARDYTSPAKAWSECEHGDWMLWLLGQLSGVPESDARKLLVLAACDCADLAMPHAKTPVVAKCIKTARRWAKGKATIEQLREARNDAAADAAYAAYAAADAAAAAAAAAYAARKKTLATCADIVRQHYPRPPVIKLPLDDEEDD